MSWPAPTGEPVGPETGGTSGPSAPAINPTAPQRSREVASTTDPAGRSDNVHPPTRQLPTDAARQGGEHYPPTQQLPTVHQPPAGAPGHAAESTAASTGQIETLAPVQVEPPHLAPLNQRTGQPARPWTIWLSTVLLFAGAIAVTVGMSLAMWAMASPWERVQPEGWTKIDKFNEATWLTAQFPSEPASGLRVLFAILCCLIGVVVAGSAAVVGYYAFSGYRWTRFGALVALGLSLLSLLLTPIASISIALIALGAAPLWLPASTRYFTRWRMIRHPEVAYAEPVDHVVYGPLPRYR